MESTTQESPVGLTQSHKMWLCLLCNKGCHNHKHKLPRHHSRICENCGKDSTTTIASDYRVRKPNKVPKLFVDQHPSVAPSAIPSVTHSEASPASTTASISTVASTAVYPLRYGCQFQNDGGGWSNVTAKFTKNLNMKINKKRLSFDYGRVWEVMLKTSDGSLYSGTQVNKATGKLRALRIFELTDKSINCQEGTRSRDVIKQHLHQMSRVGGAEIEVILDFIEKNKAHFHSLHTPALNLVDKFQDHYNSIGENSNCSILYHATNRSSAKSILRNGFQDVGTRYGKFYGSGLYLTNSISEAIASSCFSKSAKSQAWVFVCDVFVGKRAKTTPDWKYDKKNQVQCGGDMKSIFVKPFTTLAGHVSILGCIQVT